MASYYRHDQQSKIYKVSQYPDGVWLYWVIMLRLEDGGFSMGRGRNRFESLQKAIDFCELLCTPSTEQEYLDTLTAYFRADQRIREKHLN